MHCGPNKSRTNQGGAERRKEKNTVGAATAAAKNASFSKGKYFFLPGAPHRSEDEFSTHALLRCTGVLCSLLCALCLQVAAASLPDPSRWYKFDATNPLADSGTEGKDLYHGHPGDPLEVKFLCPSGGCVDFQSDSPYLALDAMQTSSSRFTLSFYLRISSYTSSRRQLLCFSQDECITMRSQKWGFTGGGDSTIWDQSSLTPKDKWVHLLFVFNPPETAVDEMVYVYRDGSMYGNWTLPNDNFFTAMDDSEWWLGHLNSNSQEFIGEMSDFRIFDNVALDADQVLEEYTVVATESPNWSLQPSNLPTRGGVWVAAEVLVSAVGQSSVLRVI